MLWDFQTRAGLTNSNQKSWVLVGPMRVLPKGHIRLTGSGRQGKPDHKGCLGTYMRNCLLLLILLSAVRGKYLFGKSSYHLKLLQASWVNKMDAEATML